MNNFESYLSRVILDGNKKSFTLAFAVPHRQAGVVQGIEDCKGRNPDGLKLLLAAARESAAREEKTGRMVSEYQYARGYLAGVEWVCNCASAYLAKNGQTPVVPPTTTGFLEYSRLAELPAARAAA